MSDLFAAVPPLASFLHFVGDILRTGYSDRRNEREAFILHIRHIITLLDSILMSGSDAGLDNLWISNLRTKLTHILEDLTPKNRSILRRVRARWICHERFIHETNYDIDGVLKLIQLHTVVSLNGGVASLRGEVEQLMLDARFNDSTPPAHNTVCRCGASRDPADRGYASVGASDPGTTARWGSEELDQILNAAYQNVLYHRSLVDQDDRHRPCLANALDLLARLYQQAGRLDDAFQYSLEANRVLGVMARDASLLPENVIESLSPLGPPLAVGLANR